MASEINTQWSTSLPALTARHLIALFIIGVLSVASYISLNTILSPTTLNGGLVNLSGRQRMYTQRIPFLALELSNAKTALEREKAHRDLAEAIDSMEKLHGSLIHGNKELALSPVLPPSIHAMYFDPPMNMDLKIRRFIDEAKAFNGESADKLNSKNPHLQYLISEGQGPLLNGCDQLVLEGQKSKIGERKTLVDLHFEVLLLTLFALVFIAFFIFRPMVRQIDRERISLLDAQKRLGSVLDAAAEAIFSLDADGKILTANREAALVWGHEPKELIGRSWQQLFSEEKAILQKIISLSRQNEKSRWELHAENRQGQTFIAETRISHFKIGDESLFTLACQDITERKRAEERLAYLATRDPLTQLFNRNQLNEVIESTVKEARMGQRGALLYIDLDNFKLVNDSGGHLVGDQFLIKIASVLREVVQHEDTIIRFGGDEFMVVLHNTNLEEAQALGKTMLEKIGHLVFHNNGESFNMSASIGLTIIEGDCSLDQVMAQADGACYTAKAKGRNRMEVYSDQGNALYTLKHEANWRMRIKEGLANERFEIWFQPIVNISSPKTNRYEVLLRLREPDGQIILPTVFRPAAARFKISQEIDCYVLKKALMYLLSDHNLELWINLTGEFLNDATMVDFIRKVFTVTGISPSRIVLEVSESELRFNFSSISSAILLLKSHGFQLALDQFDAGFSSFSFLQKVPVDYLKIGSEVIRELTSEPTKQLFIKAISQIAHQLKIKLVAQFVEDESTLKLLPELGIDLAQGYHIAAPRPKP